MRLKQARIGARSARRCRRFHGKLGKHDAWYLTTALWVIGQHEGGTKSDGSTVRPPNLPDAFNALLKVNDPVHGGMLLAALQLTYEIPAVVAVMAVASGAPVRVAWTPASDDDGGHDGEDA